MSAILKFDFQKRENNNIFQEEENYLTAQKRHNFACNIYS